MQYITFIQMLYMYDISHIRVQYSDAITTKISQRRLVLLSTIEQNSYINVTFETKTIRVTYGNQNKD